MIRIPTQTEYPDPQQLLDLRFTPASFTMVETNRPANLTPAMQIYSDQLTEIGFGYSHEIMVENCIGKQPHETARMLVFLNASQSAYAMLTNLHHVKSWVYFTHYFATGHRVITTSQPGALALESIKALSSTAGYYLQNTGTGVLNARRCKLRSQWKKHQNLISASHSTEKAHLYDPQQHLDAERQAYANYTNLLLDAVVLRQSDTQLVGFTHTGAHDFHTAVNSTSAKRPSITVERVATERTTPTLLEKLGYRNTAIAACAAVLVLSVASYDGSEQTETVATTAAALPLEEPSIGLSEDQADTAIETEQALDGNLTEAVTIAPLPEETLPITPQATDDNTSDEYVLASEEDELWRIAVENAEFYLMSNDGDPAPWIRTARKIAAGFNSDDPRLARSYFLAALLERDPIVAEQRYNRALKIQTKTLGLYHTETAQTLEALAWVAESARDDLEEAIEHQRLALNVYRTIFGEDAEDTRAARWKLQYFEDRLEGLRPKSEDNRRLLPALARFAR